ncbi:S49 family peptidase [Comamonas jiangduensis]|uniref:S49 family peptidase n=1 Tax=Comamonas jiangduensis TaxID=1194168 RepID=UPI0024E10107|nr:S49 family peptidase [Comamonas jiangduensis]
MSLLLAEFYNSPWVLEATVHAKMADVLERWAMGVKLGPEQIQLAVGNAPEVAARRQSQTAAQSGGGTMVLPVHGVLTNRAHAKAASTVMTSAEELGADIRAAMRNPDVGRIVLDVDSPGGSAFGVQEVGDAIYEARQAKPVIAVVNATAASGGYWIASQATEVVLTPSGMVGSIGAYMAHVDRSAQYEKEGQKVTYVYAGKHKVEGNDTGPMSDETLAYVQTLADQCYASFVQAVARGRGVTAAVAGGESFGQGRMVMADAALKAGMVDRLGTLSQVLAEGWKPMPNQPSSDRRVASAQQRLRVLQLGDVPG